MAITYNGKIDLLIKGVLDGGRDVGTAAHSLNHSKKYNISNGTGANQANMMFSDERTLTASSSEELDLAGSLSDAFGNTITFTTIKAIYIEADSDNTNNVEVGGSASNAFVLFDNPTDILPIRPGGCFLIADFGANGYDVTAGTGDLLKIANSAGSTSVTYKIILIGEV